MFYYNDLPKKKRYIAVLAEQIETDGKMCEIIEHWTIA